LPLPYPVPLAKPVAAFFFFVVDVDDGVDEVDDDDVADDDVDNDDVDDEDVDDGDDDDDDDDDDEEEEEEEETIDVAFPTSAFPISQTVDDDDLAGDDGELTGVTGALPFFDGVAAAAASAASAASAAASAAAAASKRATRGFTPFVKTRRTSRNSSSTRRSSPPPLAATRCRSMRPCAASAVNSAARTSPGVFVMFSFFTAKMGKLSSRDIMLFFIGGRRNCATGGCSG
jgi:hypothetical protein